MSRLSANGVPANRISGGKKSEIDGPWNPPSELSTETNETVEMSSGVIRAFSGVNRSQGTVSIRAGLV